MRDMVEIGMGRTARRTYELDDINIAMGSGISFPSIWMRRQIHPTTSAVAGQLA